MADKNITPYQDINEILLHLSVSLKNILANNIIGIYLSGSLSYDDFNPDSSDIDLAVIVNKAINTTEREQLKQLHKDIQKLNERWHDRLECSYVPIDMLKETLPPKEPRPYYNNGIFYDEAPFGNEWIINNYLLYEHGIAVIGIDIKKLINPINIIDVQKACVRDLFQEWEPKISNTEWLNNGHNQSYCVLTLCRILYTILCSAVGTKKAAAAWVKNRFDLHWKNLIEA